jgi:hypothetical protein
VLPENRVQVPASLEPSEVNFAWRLTIRPGRQRLMAIDGDRITNRDALSISTRQPIDFPTASS